jgi:hypothetical protein
VNDTRDERFDMAKYVLLIHGIDEEWAALSPEQTQEAYAAHRRFSEVAGARVLGGEELEPATTATTLRGEMITDGPFLETKEVLGGFYLIEAADLDEAVALARLLPEVNAGHSGVEIRPVVDHG